MPTNNHYARGKNPNSRVNLFQKGNTFGSKRLSYKHTETTKRKLSIIHRTSISCKKAALENVKRASLANRDRKYTKEQCENISRSKKGNNGHVGLHILKPGLRREGNNNWKGGVSLVPGYRSMMAKLRDAREMGAIGSHTFEEWETLKRFYDYMCLCCEKQEPEIELTEDHIIPLIKGGSNYISNIQPLCRSCNSRKGIKIIIYGQFSSRQQGQGLYSNPT